MRLRLARCRCRGGPGLSQAPSTEEPHRAGSLNQLSLADRPDALAPPHFRAIEPACSNGVWRDGAGLLSGRQPVPIAKREVLGSPMYCGYDVGRIAAARP